MHGAGLVCYELSPRAKRHKWKSAEHVGSQVCGECGLHRRRPISAIRRGRLAVSDWDYFIDDRWQRRQTVPPCKSSTAC